MMALVLILALVQPAHVGQACSADQIRLQTAAPMQAAEDCHHGQTGRLQTGPSCFAHAACLFVPVIRAEAIRPPVKIVTAEPLIEQGLPAGRTPQPDRRPPKTV
ncbi:hypothetical protein ACTTAI_12870 [Rhodobacter capsulatus]|uniref:hypothetical protein n=1 Tax=Rhodobacter capsulatus TaxID=1061 RepID=UPI00402A1775